MLQTYKKLLLERNTIIIDPKDRLKEEPRSGRVLRTEIPVAVLKATPIAIRGTRGSLFQKKDDETAD